MRSPKQGHPQAVFHTLRYIINDLGLGIFLSSSPSFQLRGFCEADWAFTQTLGDHYASSF